MCMYNTLSTNCNRCDPTPAANYSQYCVHACMCIYDVSCDRRHSVSTAKKNKIASLSFCLDACIYIYIYMYIYVCIYIYIYIHEDLCVCITRFPLTATDVSPPLQQNTFALCVWMYV